VVRVRIQRIGIGSGHTGGDTINEPCERAVADPIVVRVRIERIGVQEELDCVRETVIVVVGISIVTVGVSVEVDAIVQDVESAGRAVIAGIARRIFAIQTRVRV
jgi:hypothetical protein